MSKVNEWTRIRAGLKKLYEGKGIIECEIRFNDCSGYSFLTFAHRHKRHWYNSDPELLGEFTQTLLACQSCHYQIEYDRKLTEETFLKLRGEEDYE